MEHKAAEADGYGVDTAVEQNGTSHFDDDGSSDAEDAEPSSSQHDDSKSDPVAPAPGLSTTKMRIKLKMPKISASGLPSHHRRSPVNTNGEGPHRTKDKILPLAKKNVTLPMTAARSKKPLPMSVSENAASSSAAVPVNAADKPKPRIRSLKLPLSKKVSSGDGTVHATVVHSDDEEGDTEVHEAVATVVSSSSNSNVSGSGSTAKPIGKRRSTQPVRVKIPPLLSPGLRIAPSQSNKHQQQQQQQQQDASLSTPAQVFNQAMEEVGYNVEARTKNPHRGSSTTRTVGDMFDSNVKLCLHFPPLVPRGLWDNNGPSTSTPETAVPTTSSKPEKENGTTKPPLVDLLIQGVRNSTTAPPTENGRKKNGKRPRSWGIREMLPVTLTYPYPESFLQTQQEYLQRVEERERAIKRKQEADEEGDGQENQKVHVPDIPPLPAPPNMSKLDGFVDDHKDLHPLYPPKTQRDFVGHLDKECFHVSEGRYFGLSTNRIADPLFVGANAPGIVGVTAAGGSGLATSTVGSQATAFILNSSFSGASLHATKKPDAPDESKEDKPQAKQERTGPPSKPAPKKSSATEKNKKTASGKSSSSSSTPTASTSMLRKIMDEGGSTSTALRDSIIRAAVHASRTAKHGQPFKFGDKVFADVSKAFAAYAAVKPCQRCKNNKQGAYHCRLRRRHLDDDFDGGHSAQELKPLFEMPLADLRSGN